VADLLFAIKPVLSASISAERSKGCAHLHARRPVGLHANDPRLALIATSQQQVTLSARRINLRSPQCDRGGTHRAAAVSAVQGERHMTVLGRSFYTKSTAVAPQFITPLLVGLTHSK